MTESQSSQNESNATSFTFQKPLISSTQSETRQVERKDIVELHDGSVSFEGDLNWAASTVSNETQLSSRLQNSLSLYSHPTVLEEIPVHCNNPKSKDLPICTTLRSNIYQNRQNNYDISDSVDFDFSHIQQVKTQQTDEMSSTAVLKQLLSICFKMTKEKLEKLHLSSFLLGVVISFGASRISKKFWFTLGKCTSCLLLVYILWYSHQTTTSQTFVSWLLRKCIQLIPARYIR